MRRLVKRIVAKHGRAPKPDPLAIVCIASSPPWAGPARWRHPRSSHGSPASG
jgi:hypothetical protein